MMFKGTTRTLVLFVVLVALMVYFVTGWQEQKEPILIFSAGALIMPIVFTMIDLVEKVRNNFSGRKANESAD
jgi:di/tricarboxylate transporter